jgi:hypothetical protein
LVPPFVGIDCFDKYWRHSRVDTQWHIMRINVQCTLRKWQQRDAGGEARNWLYIHAMERRLRRYDTVLHGHTQQ